MFTSIIQKFIGKQSIQDATWVTFGSLVNGVCLFVVNTLLVRMLSQTAYGTFALAILVLSTVAEMSDFGLNAGLLRFAPYYRAQGEHEKFKQLLTTIWYWRITLSAVLTLGGVVTSHLVARYIFGQPLVTPYLQYAYIGVGGVVLLGFVTVYLQAVQRFRYHAMLQILKGVLRLIAVGILVVSGVTQLFWYLTVYIGIPWLLFGVGIFTLPKKFTTVNLPAADKSALHSQLKNFSVWLVVWSFTSIIAGRIDQAMVSNLLGLTGVAIYSVAYQCIQFFPILTQSIASVLTPRINRLRSIQEVHGFMWYALRYLVPVSVIVALVIYPSRWLIILLFGPAYAPAMPVYVVLALGITLNIVATAFTLVVTAFNQTKLMALSGAIQLLVNIGANAVLIPRYGVMGAAYAFALGIGMAFVYNVGCALYLVRYGKLHIV